MRIYTQDIKRQKLLKLVSRYFSSFTMFKALGYWKGTPEQALCFEIIPDSLFNYREDVRRLCKDIKIMNCQESVLVVEFEAGSQKVEVI